ncbi:hypothetical protein EDB85DRAFT_2017368 [Lactarius pseudohatsudake]|nr:hypothetical protein EDB85DRAFT_2017368 [Lactarius pseudohatsudake]
MLKTDARDGPLLNFCKLGHLGMMAVPFEGSSLRNTDFKKLLDLLQKMTEDRRLTLASTPIWEDLGRLRDEVDATSSMSSNEDKTNMQNLLEKIDAVYMHRPSFTQEHRPSDHGQSQATGSSSLAVVQPNPPPRGLQPEIFSYASTSTAVGEDLYDSSPADDDYKGITPAPSNNARSEHANLYRNVYPHLPSQIAPSSTITRPFYPSFLPTLSPPSESADRASPSIPSILPPSPYMRYNDQNRRGKVYYPPRGRTTSRSATLSSLISPTRPVSTPSATSFVRSSSRVYSTTPPASPAD